MIAAKYANPEIGRRNLETLMAADAGSDACCRRRRRRRTSFSQAAASAVAPSHDGLSRASSTRRRASSIISSPRRRSPKSPSSTSARARPRARRRAASRICAPFPGAFPGARPRRAAGLVRLRLGGRRLSARRTARRGMALLRRMNRGMAVLSRAAVQHGHGAGQDRSRHRAALRRSCARPARRARRFSRAIEAEWGAHRRGAGDRDPGRRERLADNPALAALDRASLRLYRAAQLSAGRTAAPLARAARSTTRRAWAFSSRSTASRRDCATRAEQAPGHVQALRRRSACPFFTQTRRAVGREMIASRSRFESVRETVSMVSPR